MLNKLKTAIFISSLTLLTITVTAQKLVNSPYSRFILGSIEPTGSFRSLGMGGISIADRNSNTIIFSNPASYSCIDTNSFVFDFGMDYSKVNLSEGTSHFKSGDMNFDHLLLGFPIKKGWGVAAGVVPFSNGYYNIAGKVEANDPEYSPSIGEYSSYHFGDGVFSTFFLGSGLMVNKNISLGLNMTVLFGQVSRSNEIEFLNSSNYSSSYHDNNTTNLQISGVNFDYGIQYSVDLKNKYFFNAGASVTFGKNFKSTYQHKFIKYTTYQSSDTLNYISDDSTKAFIPGTYRLGIAFGKKDKFTTAIDYISTRWSKSKIPGAAGYVADSRSLMIGAEFIPDKYSNYSFLKRLEYRIGGHVGDNYLVLNGNQIKEYGASAGLGFPLRGTPSRINIFFDYTRKTGSPTNITYSEDYYTFGLSLNFHDLWFMKRKYD
jgi:hypothetical protein